MTVKEYIQKNISLTVINNTEKRPNVFELPKPYSVPTVGETFRALFYWDTYFTNLALLELGDVEQAKNNVEDFAYLIKTLGFIPNANTSDMSDRSQPPFFSLMVRDIFNKTGDVDWLGEIYPALCDEHRFWIENRNTNVGLAHYGTTVSPDREANYAKWFTDRIGAENTLEMQKTYASNFLAQAESGWDFNARFDFDSIDYCPVDLNALLWALEDNLAKFAEALGNREADKWRAAADTRALKMREFLLDSDGVFRDRNSVTGKFSSYTSMASLFPLFVGLANAKEAQATVKYALPKLLHAWGVVPLEELDDGYNYQWGSPNGWPCLQVVAAVGLANCGYIDESDKIANLYVTMVENVFEETGALWEKYNLDSGNSDAKNEYEMPEMLGWTAGAYLYLKKQPQK